MAMVRAAARKFNTTVDAIMSPTRAHLPTAARWYAWTLIRHHFGDSYPQIGRRFHKDHSTVMNGIARYFGYRKPGKTAKGCGLAIDIFLALNAEQLTAEAEQALAFAEECKMNFMLANQQALEEAVIVAQQKLRAQKDLAHAA